MQNLFKPFWSTLRLFGAQLLSLIVLPHDRM
jgi:hypothetical protein